MMFLPRCLPVLVLLTCWELNPRDSIAQTQTIASRPTSSLSSSQSALRDRGQQYFEAQEYKLAIASYLELLKLEPDNVEAYNTLGMSWGGLKQYSAAISAFDRAIALDRDFANAYYNRGYIYQQLGQQDTALEDFARALELTDGQHVSALINRASILALQQHYQLALQDLQEVVKLDPRSATAYYNRALIQLAIGNKTAYLNDLTQAEELYRQQSDLAGLTQIEQIRKLY